MTEPGFGLRRADWVRDGKALRAVREQVFVREQGVPLALEWDGDDAPALHLLAETPDGSAIGTARLLPDGQVGRMAVLAEWRGRGVGTALLKALLHIAADKHYPPLFLNAQTRAVGFYARHGFEAEGDEFEDAGIPHRRMVRP